MATDMTIGVIGSGTMGTGIAQVAATKGARVILYDQSDEALDRAKARLEKLMIRLVEKQKISRTNANGILQRILFTSEQNDIAPCKLVIEAIIENLEIKKRLFQNLETKISEDSILASNTSSLSITAIAAALSKPERFLGIHFFNPAPLMPLVEIVPALQSSEEYISRAKDIIDSLGKTTVLAKDTPGFIVNKVARPFYSESLRMMEEQIATIQQIDEALRSFAGFRMGPFELMDLIGNDVNYAVTTSVFKAFFYDPRYRPSLTQKKLVEAGYLGRKTNKGYYTYEENNGKKSKVSAPVDLDSTLAQSIVNRVLVMLINEAYDTNYTGFASKEDIDLAMTKGVNYPKGLFQWAEEIGLKNCVEHLDKLYDQYREDRYRCSPLLRKESLI